MRGGQGSSKEGAPRRGLGDQEGRDGETETVTRSGKRKSSGETKKRGEARSPGPGAHSPVYLILLLQALAVQAWAWGLGRPVGAVGPGGSGCRRCCLGEASQGFGAIHDAWVVGQLIILGGGGGKRGRAPGRPQHQQESPQP